MYTIHELRPAHMAALYELYRAQTDGLPHCLVPSAARFAADLTRPEAGRVLVAAVDDTAHGFAALRQVTDDEEVTSDSITALFFRDAAAGAALVAACVARARPGGMLAYAQAHSNGPLLAYNAGWDGLSDRLAAQVQLLVKHGFVPYYRELLLTCDLQTPFETPEIEGIRLSANRNDEGNYLQRGWIGEDRIGLCIYSTIEALADDPRAARIGYIHWLWSAEQVRRRGLARALLLRALEHLRTLGCEHCWLGTGAANWSAQGLYLGLGFRVVDGTVSFRRPA
ncbi:MAG TPA: GNAT family N-acetyltransferase [Roseiflexaceae bacterium]|nr:GNAT family N-acetyltransferase [Roseiflexaceae bacterium]